MNEISLKELKRYYDDLSDNYSILQEKFGNEMKRNDELNSKLAQAVNQYNAVVQQNQSLQQELTNKQLEFDGAESLLNKACNALTKIQRHTNCKKINHRYECNECDIYDFNEHSNCAFRIAKQARIACGDIPYPIVKTSEKDCLLKSIVAFLTEWSSQNNRGMAFPYYFTIADENDRFEANDDGEYFFDSYAGSISKIAEVLKEEFENGNIEDVTETEFEEILKNIGTYEEDERIDDWLRNYNESGIQRFGKEYETYYEGVFFTQSDAEEYLESTSNHHFGENPRTYADSFNKWGRGSKTAEFLKDLFNYFGVKVPPEIYYDKKKKEETVQGGADE